MAFDYVLKFPCEVRKSVPEAKLVALVRHMHMAEFAVAEVRRSNPAVPMETILGKYEVHVSQYRPDGTATQVPMTVGELITSAGAASLEDAYLRLTDDATEHRAGGDRR